MYGGLTGELTFRTFSPLVVKPTTDIRSEDWRAAQVKIKTYELPPIDNIRLAKSSSNVVYDGYVKAAFENEKFKRKSGSMLSENQYLTLKVKALETEKGILE
jgi:hypothetical protein